MNMYGGPIEEYFDENDYERGNRSSDRDVYPSVSSNKFASRRFDKENALSSERIMELRDRYDLNYMTCEAQENLLDELCRMGMLTKEDCEAYMISEGNLLESLARQVAVDIKMLYKMAIAGRYSSTHIKHIRSQQKILDLLEQLVTD